MSTFTPSPRLLLAISSLNSLSSPQLSAFLTQTFSSPLSVTPLPTHASFPISRTLQDALCYFFISIISNREPFDLQSFLVQASLKQELVTVFLETWGIWGGEFLKKGREKMAAVGGKVKDIGWELGVSVDEGTPALRNCFEFMGDSIKKNFDLFDKDGRNPEAIIKFKIEGAEDFEVKLGKEDVQDVFESFEKLQEKLDALLN